MAMADSESPQTALGIWERAVMMVEGGVVARREARRLVEVWVAQMIEQTILRTLVGVKEVRCQMTQSYDFFSS